MSEILHNAFHFESLVWHGPIAVYLFLLGLSAGATMIGLVLKRWVIDTPAWQNGFIRSVAIIAPLGIIISLSILILHLTKPLAFWKLMIYYNPTSVMSVGVMLFQLYTVVLFVWLAIIFYDPLTHFLQTFWHGKLGWLYNLFTTVMQWIMRMETVIEIVLGLIAVALGVYTGFLLSALKTYPMLNNPWLPLLFLFSGMSSGIAGTLLTGVTVFRESVNSAAANWMHKFEKPVVFIELLVLAIFFAWLIMAGGRSEVAALTAIASGFWAAVFWIGIVGVGLLTPLALQTLTPNQYQHNVSFVIVLTSASLIGVICLRYFILYAGQLTVF